MKYFLIFSLICAQSFAVTFEVTHPCKNEASITRSIALTNADTSVGVLTVQVLQQQNVTFRGSEAGIQSIYQTPIGDDAIDVISDNELYAYGWCYHVNKREPAQMPDKVLLQNTDHIHWFFAFSHFENGDWVSMCTPAYKRPPKPYCQN